MKKYIFASLIAILATSAFAGVNVTSPGSGTTAQSPIHYIATATTSCSKGVSTMGIYTAPHVLAYTVNGAKLETNLTLSPGTYRTTMEEWDNRRGASTTPITVTVSGSSLGVQVSAPANNATVGSPVQYVATATTSCSKGISAMGIYTAPNVLAYPVNGASLKPKLILRSITDAATGQEEHHCS